MAIEMLLPKIEGSPLKITASVGVAFCNGTYAEMNRIQKCADQAMYEAKSLGRNRVTIYEGTVNESTIG